MDRPVGLSFNMLLVHLQWELKNKFYTKIQPKPVDFTGFKDLLKRMTLEEKIGQMVQA
ncbi:hypothetical protein NC652_020032 [Populus alba x Populus x berolinensis]|nr:hypothetical protein NC652_020032 [Populus alba x Populus x berolinensis]